MMQSSTTRLLVGALWLTLGMVTACGGDSEGGVDAASAPDSAATVDAPTTPPGKRVELAHASMHISNDAPNPAQAALYSVYRVLLASGRL